MPLTQEEKAFLNEFEREQKTLGKARERKMQQELQDDNNSDRRNPDDRGSDVCNPYQESFKRGFHDLVRAEGKRQARLMLQNDPEALYKIVGEWFKEKVEITTELEETEMFRCKPKDLVGFFITVRPEPGIFTIVQLVDIFVKMVSKKGVDKYKGCFEQTGKTDATRGDGMHFHLILLLDKNDQSGERKKMYNTIKRICARVPGNDHKLNVKGLTVAGLKPRESYIEGIKTKEENPHVLSQTKIWREENEIPPIMQSDDW